MNTDFIINFEGAKILNLSLIFISIFISMCRLIFESYRVIQLLASSFVTLKASCLYLFPHFIIIHLIWDCLFFQLLTANNLLRNTFQANFISSYQQSKGSLWKRQIWGSVTDYIFRSFNWPEDLGILWSWKFIKLFPLNKNYCSALLPWIFSLKDSRSDYSNFAIACLGCWKKNLSWLKNMLIYL